MIMLRITIQNGRQKGGWRGTCYNYGECSQRLRTGGLFRRPSDVKVHDVCGVKDFVLKVLAIG